VSIRRVVSAFIVLAPLLVAASAFPADQEGCLLCHRLGIRVSHDGGSRALDVQDSPGGVHAALYCSDCHPGARTIPHAPSPGPSSCIGECHGSSMAAVTSHRRAAFGGLTETHRGVTSPRPPCLGCHAGGDPGGAGKAADARCVACHRREALAVQEGPHWRMAGNSGRCAGCHPAHPEGSPGKTPANCSGTGCHSRATPGMQAVVDHRAAESGARSLAKAAIFLALGGASWLFAGASRPRGAGGRRPE
jgi:hypothetical protein